MEKTARCFSCVPFHKAGSSESLWATNPTQVSGGRWIETKIFSALRGCFGLLTTIDLIMPWALVWVSGCFSWVLVGPWRPCFARGARTTFRWKQIWRHVHWLLIKKFPEYLVFSKLNLTSSQVGPKISPECSHPSPRTSFYWAHCPKKPIARQKTQSLSHNSKRYVLSENAASSRTSIDNMSRKPWIFRPQDLEISDL